MSDVRPTLEAGATLAGRWQVTDYIGSGELADVYGVTDTHGGAAHALKLFRPQGLTRPEVWSAFQTAVRAVSAVNAEGVARGSDFGIDGNSGRPFYVSERVSWASLGQRVAAKGPLAADELAAGLRVLARALDAAHAAGVVHRNLKPENVFISPDNPSWARITDFGVGVLRSAAPPPPGWAAQMGWHSADAADPAQRPTPAMDIYALGLVCFFALTGGSPFRALRGGGSDPNQLWRELGEPLGPASQRAAELGKALDPRFDPWFSRALASAPSDRFGKAVEMADAFAALVGAAGPSPRQNPDALPGIAAAIPQPLVFQPEPPKPSPSAAQGAPHASSSLGAQVAPAAMAAVASTADEERPGLPGRKGKLTAQLFIGGAVLCFALTAAGAYALYRVRQPDAAGAGEAPRPSAAPETAAPAPAPAEPASSAAPAAAVAKAKFSCIPGTCEWVVCDGKNIRGLDQEVEIAPGEHACSASRYGYGSKALMFVAKAGETADVVFELPPLPVGAAKKAAAAPSAPAPATKAAKTAASAAPKKADPKTAAPSKSAAPKAAPAAPAKTAPAKTTAPAKSGSKKCGTFINPCK